MPHADSSLVPSTITTKKEFWEHVYAQLDALLAGQRTWVSNLANASSVIYNALLAFPSHFGDSEKAVNWCGFYLDSTLFPRPLHSSQTEASLERLLLAPFCGKPACQFINTAPGKARGVCAEAYLKRQTILVQDVNAYPGHIACDGETNSEIVCPLITKIDGREVVLGVLDLDCLALKGFDENDKVGLEKIAQLVASACDW